VPANVAEGAGRGSPHDFAQFLVIAAASANETEYLLRLSFDLGYFDEATYTWLRSLAIEARKLILAYRAKVISGEYVVTK